VGLGTGRSCEGCRVWSYAAIDKELLDSSGAESDKAVSSPELLDGVQYYLHFHFGLLASEASRTVRECICVLVSHLVDDYL
jgi:hypothetical protein